MKLDAQPRTQAASDGEEDAMKKSPSRFDRMSDQTLNRLLKWGSVALVLAFVAFGSFYYLDQRIAGGPSISEQAVQAGEAAVTATPNSIQARLTLALAYRNDHHFEDALAQYDEILKAKDDNRSALAGRGVVLYNMGKLDDAAKALHKITDVAIKGEFAGADTTLQEAFYYLGVIALDKGETKEAIAELQSALRIKSSDSDVLYKLGVAYSNGGQQAEAVKAMKTALSFVPTGWCEPYQGLAEAYGKMADSAEAAYAGAMVDFCEKKIDVARTRLEALTTGPAAVDAMVGLGLLSEGATDREAAAKWYRQALVIDPNNTTATTGLARLDASTPTAPSSPTGSKTERKT